MLKEGCVHILVEMYQMMNLMVDCVHCVCVASLWLLWLSPTILTCP